MKKNVYVALCSGQTQIMSFAYIYVTLYMVHKYMIRVVTVWCTYIHTYMHETYTQTYTQTYITLYYINYITLHHYIHYIHTIHTIHAIHTIHTIHPYMHACIHTYLSLPYLTLHYIDTYTHIGTHIGVTINQTFCIICHFYMHACNVYISLYLYMHTIHCKFPHGVKSLVNETSSPKTLTHPNSRLEILENAVRSRRSPSGREISSSPSVPRR